MGHYLSEMTGPPFEIQVDVVVDNKLFEKLIIKKLQLPKNSKILDIDFHSITESVPHRNWFEVHYNYYEGTNCFTTVTEKEGAELIGTKRYIECLKKLEKRRKEVL